MENNLNRPVETPFQKLSRIFIENQRSFDSKAGDLRTRTRNLTEKLKIAVEQLEKDPFNANLNLFLNLEEESKLIFIVAQELERQRDKISESVSLLEKSNEIKLNR